MFPAGATTRIGTIGRYALHAEIASGGMAAVHLGRLIGPVGFARTVAIKRLHRQYAKDPEFVAMFMDEARLAARVQHLNVVPTLDVVVTDGEMFVVMEYVQGESLSALIRRARERDVVVQHSIVTGVVAGALHGLHAAHEARDERGAPLCIVHRDVSPQNIIVGVDGVARVLDFGVAKATLRVQATREGQVKGKLRYMSPEQVAGSSDHRTDIWAAGVVLWEALTGVKLFDGENAAVILARILEDPILSPSSVRPSVPRELGAVVMRALERDVSRRYQTAREMALAIESTGIATASQIGDWVQAACRDVLAERSARIAEIERSESAQSAVQLRASRPHFEESTVAEVPLVTPSSPVGASSQVSSLSVTTSATDDKLRGSPRALLPALLVVGATALVIVTAAFAWRASQPDGAPAGRSPTPTAPAASAAPAAPTPEPDAASAKPTDDSELEPVPLTALPLQTAPAPASRPAHGAQVRVPQKPAAPKPADCAVPYTIGADGIQHPKPECM